MKVLFGMERINEKTATQEEKFAGLGCLDVRIRQILPHLEGWVTGFAIYKNKNVERKGDALLEESESMSQDISIQRYIDSIWVQIGTNQVTILNVLFIHANFE